MPERHFDNLGFTGLDKYELAKLYLESKEIRDEQARKQLEAAIRMKFRFGYTRSLDEPQIRRRLEITLKNGPAGKRFLDVLGWIVIGFGGMALLSVIVQSLIFNVFPYKYMLQEYEQLMLRYGAEHTIVDLFPIIWIFGGFQAIVQLIVGFGIIKRMQWARLGMFVVLIIAALWVIGAPFLFFSFDFIPPSGNEAAQSFTMAAKIIMFGFMFFIGLLYTVIYGWVFYKMTKQEIIEEFRNPWVYKGNF